MDDVKKALDEVGGHIQELHSGQRMTNRILAALMARAEASEKTIANLAVSFDGMKAAIDKAFERLNDHEDRIQALENRSP